VAAFGLGADELHPRERAGVLERLLADAQGPAQQRQQAWLVLAVEAGLVAAQRRDRLPVAGAHAAARAD